MGISINITRLYVGLFVLTGDHKMKDNSFKNAIFLIVMLSVQGIYACYWLYNFFICFLKLVHSYSPRAFSILTFGCVDPEKFIPKPKDEDDCPCYDENK